MATQPTSPVLSAARPSDLAELEASALAAARLLKLLASEQRLILLCRLLEGECSVGDLAHYVGLAQSAVSQHLAKLRAERLVATRREGQTIYYRLVDPAAARVIDLLCELFRGAPEAAPD
jgi:ArsR family transcriptional regulator, virulence genes transcriptional regulator